METEFSGNVVEYSSDDDFSTSSSGSEEDDCGGSSPSNIRTGPINLCQKLINRECTGYFSGKRCSRNQSAFNKVPNRLGFCLKDIVPPCFLQGHMFMGLSACGQFLLSYKVCCNDNFFSNHYSFNIGYKYTLYFWIYQPHKPLRSFYKCCLFDDHGVDNLKEVTMTQWKCADPRILVIHGAAENENEDSYITYVKVPKLGCLDCKKLRESDDGYFRRYALCLKCNLTIHTKYSSMESDRKFSAFTNLICPERILIIANGIIHMLRIDLELPAYTTNQVVQQISHTNVVAALAPDSLSTDLERRSTPASVQLEEDMGCDNHNNIVARIVADFSDTETEAPFSVVSKNTDAHGNATGESSSSAVSTRKTYDELIFTCTGSSSAASSGSSAVSKTGGSTQVSMVSHRGKRHHRIVTKSYRNGITTVDMQNAIPSSSNAADKSNAYEFSEDNEKCEKISILRKRRLADKKYEFSEDNSENIVPFTKIRSASKSTTSTFFNTSSARSLHRAPGGHHFYNSPCPSPSSSPHPSHTSSSGCDSRHCTPPPIHRSSPIQGFRSPPCSSSVSAGIPLSPSRHATSVQIYGPKSAQPSLSLATQQMLSFKPLGTLSPLQVSMTKRGYMDFSGSMSPSSNVPFLSPKREELRVVEVPLQGAMTEKPVCTKKFKRRYVEEDDAASVITSEEDDCISPGYHTSLPMEVHGSSYSEMQMISQASFQKLRCASVVITQHSFDLETFTYYVISTLCQKNNKTYDVFYDWAYELINVCPLSSTISCLLMAQFAAWDELLTKCLNCSRKFDCVFHRRQYECRILFTWNMESGDWEVLDYGQLLECKRNNLTTMTLGQTATKLANELATSINKIYDYTGNLRVLDSNTKKSKTRIADTDNMVEFFLKRPRNNE